MSENKCPSCGATIDVNSSECKYCGEVIPGVQQQQYKQQYQAPPQGQVPPQYGAPQYGSPQVQQIFVQQPSEPINTKSKIAAGILGILLGGIGVHKFYLGRIGMGIIYILFCWTYIPAIIGFIEGIIYLTSSDEKFYAKYVKKY